MIDAKHVTLPRLQISYAGVPEIHTLSVVIESERGDRLIFLWRKGEIPRAQRVLRDATFNVEALSEIPITDFPRESVAEEIMHSGQKIPAEAGEQMVAILRCK